MAAAGIQFKIDADLSRKLRFVSWVCALLVILQHTFATDTFVQCLATQSLTRAAVPFFFVMSGFLLFKDYEPSIPWALNKIKSRCRTLLLPLFSWAIISLALNPISFDFKSIHWWLSVFGIVGAAPLSAGHLWYVRTLFLFVLFAVPIALLLRYLGWIVPVLSMAVCVVALKSVNWHSLCWFSAGALIAIKNQNFVRTSWPLKKVATLGCLALSLAVIRTIGFLDASSILANPRVVRAGEAIVVVLLIMTIWLGAGRVMDAMRNACLDVLFPSSFFIYCLHVYVYPIIPVDWFWALRFVIVAALCVGLYLMVKRYFPKALIFLSGGREMKVVYITHYSGSGGANIALLHMILWVRRLMPRVGSIVFGGRL